MKIIFLSVIENDKIGQFVCVSNYSSVQNVQFYCSFRNKKIFLVIQKEKIISFFVIQKRKIISFLVIQKEKKIISCNSKREKIIISVLKKTFEMYTP